MMKRIAIARDGTVKLRGVRTRWRVRRNGCGDFRVGGASWKLTDEYFEYLADARTYLEALTDEELLG